jgi:quercetin dioxygenase-like cupin family protein
MFRRLIVSAALLAGCAVGWAAVHDEKGAESVKILGSSEIIEVVDGNEAMATIAEVTIAPGKEGMPHKHPGPVFGYVQEGEYELGIGDKPTKIYKAGETFYEPTGILHRVSRNPSKETTTKLIATIVHARKDKNIVLPPYEKH